MKGEVDVAKIQTEMCGGCGKEIPDTETPFIWKDETLCRKCWNEVMTKHMPDLNAPPAPAPPSVYDPPKQKTFAVIDSPRYAAILVISTFMQALGILELLLGVVLVVLAVQSDAPTASASVAMAVSLIVSGVIAIAIGQAIACLRDMAINSFYIRNQTAKM